jgi:hypothetical protein
MHGTFRILGSWALPIIWYCEEHSVLEITSVDNLSCGGWEISAPLGPLERANLNLWATSRILYALYMYVSLQKIVPQL